MPIVYRSDDEVIKAGVASLAQDELYFIQNKRRELLEDVLDISKACDFDAHQVSWDETRASQPQTIFARLRHPYDSPPPL